MKQNTMFPNLIQKFITEEDVALLTQLIGYRDTARKLTVGKLIEYLVHRSGVRMERLPPLRGRWHFRWIGGRRPLDPLQKDEGTGLPADEKGTRLGH